MSEENMATKKTRKSFRSNRQAVSPAISTVLMTSALVVMVLVAMTYAQTYLNFSMAENEFSTNRQFMLTSGLQMDDIAWTIGRTQTVRYSSNFGHVTFENATLFCSCEVSADEINWQEVFNYTTGIILFNMPVADYTLGNGYFERVFPAQNSSFCQEGASAPVCHVFVVEQMPMTDGSFARVVAAPSVRMLRSSIETQNYVKFYMPQLINGTDKLLSQSVTLAGENVLQYVPGGFTYVRFTVAYPKSGQGFDFAFFGFDSGSVTVTLPSNSVVEFYLGTITVSIGLHA
ncbi:MAG: hypothetical protein NWF05_11665 [Candidatus Bathyarchaeota archaeon]|nr:hypothetical protein [Candidatus Bathyarchaeota archaeon]